MGFCDGGIFVTQNPMIGKKNPDANVHRHLRAGDGVWMNSGVLKYQDGRKQAPIFLLRIWFYIFCQLTAESMIGPIVFMRSRIPKF